MDSEIKKEIRNIVVEVVQDVIMPAFEIVATKKELADFRNDLTKKVDSVYKEVKDMREEQTMHQGQHIRVNEELEDYDQRLEKLEKSSGTF